MSIEETIKASVKEAVEEALKNIPLGSSDDLPEIMNVKQTAKFLNCSTQWVYDNIGQIPHMELSGYKFIKSELMKWCIDKTGVTFKLVRKVNN